MLLLCLITLLAANVASSRILLVLPTPTRSHAAGGARLARALSARGHALTVISPRWVPLPEKCAWVPVEVDSLADVVPNIAEQLVETQFCVNSQRNMWTNFATYTRHITRLPRLSTFIREDHSQFDLIITEEFSQSVFYMFAHKYRAPLVIFTTFGTGHYISHFMGNSLELASVPHEFIDLFGPMDFFQRMGNLGFTLYDLVFRRVYSTYAQDLLAQELFGHLGELPSLAELEANVSLALVNAHFSLGGARPLLPNMVEVGGLHIEEPKPLSEELQRILDASPGAVVLSLGSVTDLSLQPDAFARATLAALARVPAPVVVKWDSEKELPLPSNVTNIHAVRWLPQSDILAHPHVALLVTHGGLLSAQEALARAVPTVCVPLFADQPRNCRRSQELRLGVHLDPSELTADSLFQAINTVLTDRSYRDSVEEHSARFRDRPAAAVDTAVYWVEYCIRHRGMDFARSPQRQLFWFQHCFVDAALFLWLVYRCAVMVVKVVASLLRRKVKKE